MAEVADLLPEPGRLRRVDARAANGLVQQPSHGEGTVADRLGGQPESRGAGQQPVVGIAFQERLRDVGRLAVGPGEQHRLEKSPDVPAGGDELRGEPVEQLRMGRPFTLRAEVLGGLHQAGSEEHLPVAVHRDPGG